MTTAITAPAELPRWSSRVPRGQDREQLLDLFTEPDFYFRTERPRFLPEREIDEILGDGARLLLADGQLAGLYAFDAEGSPHGCHFSLNLRLRASAPLPWWISAYHELDRAIRWQREVVRLSMHFAEFDARGLRAARAMGLTEEGTLAGVAVHDGRRHGRVFFSRTWRPAS